jgi:diacylglycerol O-acyltransferase / wax synthase
VGLDHGQPRPGERIRAALGGTVNDVLLAAITGGFRDLLIERGELSEGLVVRSLVPIALRRKDERGVSTNRVSAVLANLPVAEPDPVRRLELLRGQMDVAIFSYLDRFSFGITADYSAAPDLDVLTKGIRRSLAELQAQSAGRRPTPARRRARS